MKNFMQIASGVDVSPLLLEIHQRPDLWDRQDCRLSKKGPHSETHDMFLRYKDMMPNQETNDWKNFRDEHEAVWYPAFYALPSARALIFSLMARIQGERLGGIFIYSVPPGKKIHPHADPGWHAATFDKFNICLQSNPKAAFLYDGEAMFQRPGDVHRFVNTVPHSIVNEGTEDHIVMIVCAQVHNYEKRYKGEEKYPLPTVEKKEEFTESVDFVNGEYRRSIMLDQVGKMVAQHRHEFDHQTEVTMGKARLWKNGVWAGDFKKGDRIETKANVQHVFQALVPNTAITCIWPEDVDPENVIVVESSPEMENA